ncbi:MAG: T9SS type A sorting domain-containing protein [Bacteroidales bacterium]|nr:T9SS type A sorting domain-containing protein [Candidatus Latescibacterota bacterium]
MNRSHRFTTIVFAAVIISLFPFAECIADESAFITTTDYETGSSSVIWLDGSYTTDVDVTAIHSDAIARWYDGLVYIVNRSPADNIQVLDPEAGFSTIRQFSTGNGTNPQDIAFRSPSKAYIPLYESNDILIMNPTTGANEGSIDLSAFADADGLCEVSRVFIKHDILFATIQRLDRNNYWGPVGDSYIAVVDCASDTLIDCDDSTPGIQAIQLAGTNPFSAIVLDPSSGNLAVSCVGWWGVQDAGVELIDPSSLSTAGYLLTESAAGGDINDIAVLDASKGFAIVTNSSFQTDVISFNPSTGLAVSTIYSPGAYVLNDIEISPNSELFIADQTATSPGIHIYDALAEVMITSSPISTGLPPFNISFSASEFTGTEIPPVARLGSSYPNPFNPSTTIPYFTNSTSRVRLEIFDITGRMISTLVDEIHEKGAYKAFWDGRNENGLTVASGVYFLRFTSGDVAESKKLVLVR